MTRDEQNHIEQTKLYVGCLPCLLKGHPNGHADYHHAEAGHKRKPHKHGFGMCLWHHRGEYSSFSMSLSSILERYGPSFALMKRSFIDEFCAEPVLVETNNFALMLWRKGPWLDHDMPGNVQLKIQLHHNQSRPFLT